MQKVQDFHNECGNALYYKEEYEKLAERLPEEGTLVKLGRRQTSLEYAGQLIKNLFTFTKRHPAKVALGTGMLYGTYKGVNHYRKGDTMKNKINFGNKLNRTHGYQ